MSNQAQPTSATRAIHRILGQSFLRFGVIAVFMAILAFFAARSELAPVLPPTPTPTTARVTADQVGTAMAEDHFYEDYGQATLVIQSTVAAVTTANGHARVELRTSQSTKVFCDLAGPAAKLQPGDAVTVRAAGADAQRSNGAVVLTSCAIQS
jgi:hypothetical protein